MALGLGRLNDAAHDACATGRSAIPRRTRQKLLARYDELVADAIGANSTAPGHQRDALEREARNLAVCFCDHNAEITQFPTDLGVPFTNTTAQRSFPMAKLHRKVSGRFQSEKHARHFATISSYLDTAAKHRVGAMDVPAALCRGTLWILPRSA